MCTADATHVVADELDLARVQPAAHLDPEAPPRELGHRIRAADRPGRTVEGGQEAVAHRLDRPAAEALQLAHDTRRELLEQLAPALVAQPRDAVLVESMMSENITVARTRSSSGRVAGRR